MHALKMPDEDVRGPQRRKLNEIFSCYIRSTYEGMFHHRHKIPTNHVISYHVISYQIISYHTRGATERNTTS